MFLISNNSWQIKETEQKGVGIFTTKEITAGTIIGDYLGEIIKTAEYNLDLDKNGLFLMYYSDEACIYPNLKRPGVHLLNHSCEPNCWIYTYQGHTLFFALRDISPGEELTISYLLSPKDDCKNCTHDCKCESSLCTGTMHMPHTKYNKWQEFQNIQEKKTKKPKPKFGKNLPKLNTYPKINPNNLIYQEVSGLTA